MKNKKTVLYQGKECWEIERKPVTAFNGETGVKIRDTETGKTMWVRAEFVKRLEKEII